MDGAEACDLYSTVSGDASVPMKSRRAWRFVTKRWGVSPGGTASSADLGGSSKYSNENFED